MCMWKKTIFLYLCINGFKNYLKHSKNYQLFLFIIESMRPLTCYTCINENMLKHILRSLSMYSYIKSWTVRPFYKNSIQIYKRIMKLSHRHF